MTVAQVLQLARQIYNAQDDSFFSDSELYGLLTKAQLEIAQRTFCIESTYTTSSVANTAEYALPTNAFSVRRVEYNGVKLQKVTKREEDSIRFNQTNTPVTGTPRYYSEWDSAINLVPAPSASSVTIKIYTYNFPDFVTASSTIEIPAAFHYTLVDFLLSSMHAKDGNQSMATYYRSLFEKGITDGMDWQKRRKRGDAPAQVQSEENLEVSILGMV